MEKVEFDFDDEYNQYRRRQRIHRISCLIPSVVRPVAGRLIPWRKGSRALIRSLADPILTGFVTKNVTKK